MDSGPDPLFWKVEGLVYLLIGHCATGSGAPTSEIPILRARSLLIACSGASTVTRSIYHLAAAVDESGEA